MQLVHALKDRGVAWFTGSSTLEARHRAAVKFQGDPECQFFIGNIEAAGTGITLTMASRVVFVEPDWRGTYMEQAEDPRAPHRSDPAGEGDLPLAQGMVHGPLDVRKG